MGCLRPRVQQKQKGCRDEIGCGGPRPRSSGCPRVSGSQAPREWLAGPSAASCGCAGSRGHARGRCRELDLARGSSRRIERAIVPQPFCIDLELSGASIARERVDSLDERHFIWVAAATRSSALVAGHGAARTPSDGHGACRRAGADRRVDARCRAERGRVCGERRHAGTLAGRGRPRVVDRVLGPGRIVLQPLLELAVGLGPQRADPGKGDGGAAAARGVGEDGARGAQRLRAQGAGRAAQARRSGQGVGGRGAGGRDGLVADTDALGGFARRRAGRVVLRRVGVAAAGIGYGGPDITPPRRARDRIRLLQPTPDADQQQRLAQPDPGPARGSAKGRRGLPEQGRRLPEPGGPRGAAGRVGVGDAVAACGDGRGGAQGRAAGEAAIGQRRCPRGRPRAAAARGRRRCARGVRALPAVDRGQGRARVGGLAAPRSRRAGAA